MGLKWTTELTGLEEVKKTIDSCIKRSRVPPFATITWEANELVIRIDSSGKSEFRFSISGKNSGSLLEEIKRDVALLHRPFVGTVETIVEKVLKDAGFSRV